MIDYDLLTERQRKRYDRIVHTTEMLIYEQGFYKLSLTELTQKLNVSRSTIYENFGSKEGLIEAVVRRYDQRFDEALQKVLSNKKLSIRNKFIAVANQLTESIEGKNTYRFLTDLKTHLPDLYALYSEGRNRRVRYCYRPLVKEGFEKGIFDKSLKPDFILQTYLKLTQMICETDIIEKSSISKTEAMDTIIKIFLNGAKKI